MITLRNVSFQYEGCGEGVHDIDLIVHDGECVVLTGPSGLHWACHVDLLFW